MRISVSEFIAAEQKKVFELFSDIDSSAKYLKDVTKIEFISDKKSGVGAKWRETRVMYGKEATEELEITEIDEPHHIVIEGESSGTHYKTQFSFVPEGNGTRVTMVFSGRPLSMKAKLLGIVGFLFKPAMRKALRKDIFDIKMVAEGTK